MLQYLFNCATRTIESLKSGNNVIRGNTFDITRDQRNAEKRCKFSSKKFGVSVSELTVFGRKKGGKDHPVVNLKELNKMVPYAHFKIECMFRLNSQNITLSLPQEKVKKIKIQCKELLEKALVTVRELKKLIGQLLSTVISVLPESLQYATL